MKKVWAQSEHSSIACPTQDRPTLCLLQEIYLVTKLQQWTSSGAIIRIAANICRSHLPEIKFLSFPYCVAKARYSYGNHISTYLQMLASYNLSNDSCSASSYCDYPNVIVPVSDFIRGTAWCHCSGRGEWGCLVRQTPVCLHLHVVLGVAVWSMALVLLYTTLLLCSRDVIKTKWVSHVAGCLPFVKVHMISYGLLSPAQSND